MKRWIVLAITLFSTACLPQATATVTPIYEVPKEEPPVEPTATPVCQHFAGVTLKVRRISDSRVELHVNGLQPGEKPSVIYSTFISGASSMGEVYGFAVGADEQGQFSFDLGGLRPLEGQTSANWDIRLIHARGVECATITLP